MSRKPGRSKSPPAAPRGVQDKLRKALALHQSGQMAAAQALYREVLEAEPKNVDGLHLLGVSLVQSGDAAAGAGLIRQALALKPDLPGAHNNLGLACRTLKQPAEALDAYDRAVALKPDDTAAHFNRALLLEGMGRREEALAAYDRTLATRPDHAEALSNRGVLLAALGKPVEALASYDRALAAKPGLAAAHANRGAVLAELKRPAEALAAYDRALALKPDFVEAHFNRASALTDLLRHDEALASLDRVLALDPANTAAANKRGLALLALRRPRDALACYDALIARKADMSEAHTNRGNALLDMKRLPEAVASYDRSLALRPANAIALNNRGNALLEMQRLEEAIDSYRQALAIRPDYDFLPGLHQHLKLRICDWSGLDAYRAEGRRRIEAGGKVVMPFAALNQWDEPALHRVAAQTFNRAKFPRAVATRPTFAAAPAATSVTDDRIRIGYYSADFHNHATSHLMAGLFESHDRKRFEIVGISFGPRPGGPMSRRVEAAFDHFHVADGQSDRAVAEWSRARGIDIAVDLKGPTQDARTGIFAHFCAPVQVNYLGFPGTMGADYIDYVIADDVVIPPDRYGDYTEKVVALPHSYQVNDARRRASDRVFTRAELGLPETGFVFCCFNNNFKILPETFDSWMRILAAVEGSVLWLLEDNAAATRNLRREAAARGIDPARLVFAGRLKVEDHLARHRRADLCLDTLPYNAHTTASDALWMGLPVLTLAGRAFAGRVAASLLRAVGLPELVVETPAAYEAEAIALARTPDRLAALTRTLVERRATAPLFDTALFARHIEAAYEEMMRRHRAGLPPDHIAVPA